WVDLAPTFLGAAGIPVPDAVQGESLEPLIRGADVPWREWALCHYRNSGNPYPDPAHVTMLRHGRYKLVVHHGSPASSRERTGELYDLETDPQELTNLWHEAGHRETRMWLQETLLDVEVATEDRSAARVAVW
ncbi:MAG: DUF4976 domain-containing protein, partial [Brachybacterium sp.]|uniref:sulfatase/phosphatase domain-containing protein n=1 Tax=Brachybacterium sp. TaxID=1891286 RepID=UPI00264844EF